MYRYLQRASALPMSTAYCDLRIRQFLNSSQNSVRRNITFDVCIVAAQSHRFEDLKFADAFE